jgi:hypothetical protein
MRVKFCADINDRLQRICLAQVWRGYNNLVLYNSCDQKDKLMVKINVNELVPGDFCVFSNRGEYIPRLAGLIIAIKEENTHEFGYDVTVMFVNGTVRTGWSARSTAVTKVCQ